ncbi:MAG TPA: YtxH domain-containing protein [Spirochaetota bacterium]|nr:YtxH domain-containing protein [Spirochaetota bacterium]HPC40466.1 YtxH domain-containing protein [Spirochaetota bacterium]HPL15795.1 YtxH domain-containing protein [Spirochaetota bacterium]HQF06533.1 YtxH domain-containing protein [Spirochaetota bacterium]HQH96064.1 YtxH domain-containing protein [Spirochaetota bacterium]
MSDNNDGLKTLMTFVIGAAVGAVFGALFAPKPGKELRQDLRDFSERLAEDAKSEYVKISEKAKDVGGKAKNFAEEARSRFRKGGEDPDAAT